MPLPGCLWTSSPRFLTTKPAAQSLCRGEEVGRWATSPRFLTTKPAAQSLCRGEEVGRWVTSPRFLTTKPAAQSLCRGEEVGRWATLALDVRWSLLPWLDRSRCFAIAADVAFATVSVAVAVAAATSADRSRVKAEIAAVDPAEAKTYEGACRFLREKFWSYPAARPDN